MKETYILEGNISVKAAILSPYREVHKVIVDIAKKDKDTNYILAKAHEQHIPVEKKTREEIDLLADGSTHGGLLALCGERQMQSLQDINVKEISLLALIDGVEDPFNFGYMLRSLYAAGCDGVIVSPRNWTTAASALAKASAGASEYIKLIVADDWKQTLDKVKKMDYQIVAGQRSDAVSLFEYEFPNKTLIAIGGEMRGLSKHVLSYCDQNLFIPYANDFRNALNGSSATAIFAFEYVRQKK